MAMVISGARWGISAVAMALVFPVMINRLGAASFGYWAALTAPTSMSGLVGFGIAPAIVSLMGRAIGAARAARTEDECGAGLSAAGAYVAAGMTVTAAAAVAAFIAGWLVASPIVSALNVPASEAVAAVNLFHAAVVGLSFALLGNAVSAQVDAIGRVELTALGTGLLSVTNSALLLVALLVSPTFDALALVVLTTGVLSIVVPAVLLVISKAYVVLRWMRWQRIATWRMVRLAPALGGASAASALIDPLVKWSLGSAVGPIPVAAYEVSWRVVTVVTGVFTASLYPLLPHVAAGVGEGRYEELLRTVDRSVRAVTGLAFPTLAALAVASAPLLDVWLRGAVPAGTVTSLQLLSAASFLVVATTPAYQALQGSGRGLRVLTVQLVTLGVVAVVLGLVITTPYAFGVAYLVAVACATPVADLHFATVFGWAALKSMLRATLPALAPSLVVVAVPLFAQLLGGGSVWQLVTTGLVWCLVLVAVARLGLLGDAGLAERLKIDSLSRRS